MIYTITKNNITYLVDDLVIFINQPKEFKEMYNKIVQDNMAYFDNAYIMVLETGRVIITEKIENNE